MKLKKAWQFSYLQVSCELIISSDWKELSEVYSVSNIMYLAYFYHKVFLRISVSFYCGAFHLTHSEADSCSQGFFMLSFARSPSKMKILFPHNSFILICVILKFPVANVILRSLLGKKIAFYYSSYYYS